MSLALVEPIRRAMKEDRVTTLACAVARLSDSGAFETPDLFCAGRPERYARRLIWREPGDRFVVIGMTWAPGQRSPLHDHGGVWGVEIVVRGTMFETAYRVARRDEYGRIEFAAERDRLCPAGSAGVLVPPHDHHVFGNAGSEVAHTLHVYGGAFASSNMYLPDGDGFYSAQRVTLGYDA